MEGKTEPSASKDSVPKQDVENDAISDDPDISDYGDDDDIDEYDDDDVDDYLSELEKLNDVDLPPGVEFSVSLLNNTAKNSNTSIPLDVSPRGGSASSSSGVVEASAPSIPVSLNSKGEVVASSSSCAEPSSSGKENEEDVDEIVKKYVNFRRFDIVDDYSDHQYSVSGFNGRQPPVEWIKRVQNEWKNMEKDVPDTIYVRVYESRMDLLRAIIVGPEGTPYHDGLFVFDVLFPPSYPNVPPMVYYYSGGLRLNPNLYECGKVCLSLLNTWEGKGSEKWVPKSSTMLQVLLSIQALILNEKPFFNEPGHDQYHGREGQIRSNSYNEEVCVLSLKTMVYTLRRPPKHFEELVAGHFHSHAHTILSSCRAYMEGAMVGSLVKGKVSEDTPAAQKHGGSSGFKAAVGRMINGLISNFSRHGVKDCEQFRP